MLPDVARGARAQATRTILLKMHDAHTNRKIRLYLEDGHAAALPATAAAYFVGFRRHFTTRYVNVSLVASIDFRQVF